MTNAPSPRRSQVFLLVFLAGIFFVNFVCRIIAAPLMPVIEKDLGFSHSGAGLFFMMAALGYSAGLVVSGLVSSRITHRNTISLLTMAAGCSLIMIAASYQMWMIRLGIFLVGVFTGLYLPSAITTITSSITAKNWGKAFAVHELAPSLAFVTSPFLAESLLLVLTWRVILVLIGLSAIVMGFAYRRLSAGGNFRGEAPTFGNIRLITGNPDFWKIVVLFCAAIACSVGIYSMMPLYLTAGRGIDRETANALLGLSRIPALPAVFFAGWIVDRFGAKPTMAGVLLFNGLAVILLGLLPGRWVVLMVFLQPVLAGAFFPAGFAALSRIIPVNARSLSVSFTIFIANFVGSGLVPLLLGALGDAALFAFAFILIGSAVLASLFFIARLELKEG